MTSKERTRLAVDHQEPDRVPYDLGGTTTTAITRHAYEGAMNHRELEPAVESYNIDPIQQIVIPSG